MYNNNIQKYSSNKIYCPHCNRHIGRYNTKDNKKINKKDIKITFLIADNSIKKSI